MLDLAKQDLVNALDLNIDFKEANQLLRDV